jgi:hypothetical protein
MSCFVVSAVTLLLSLRVVLSSHCSVHTDCTSCTNDKTIFGTCRFCPVDQICHDPGAVGTNPCSTTQNIVDPTKCDATPLPAYSEAKAKSMLSLSGVAYSDQQQACLDKLGGGFKVVSSKTVLCPSGLFLNATAHCSAYAAVSTSQNIVALAYRGSMDGSQIVAEVIENLATYATYAALGAASVGKYWLDAYTSLSEVSDAAAEAIKACPGCQVWVTGHSLGAAMASLAATQLASQGFTVSQYTFGQPRVGVYEYAVAHDTLVHESFRVVHANDLVVHVPWCRHVKLDFWLPIPVCASWGGAVLPPWYHHGTEVFYNSSGMDAGSYKVCHGVPHNEDLTSGCSDTIYATSMQIPTSISSSQLFNHIHYFGVQVSAICNTLVGTDVLQI